MRIFGSPRVAFAKFEQHRPTDYDLGVSARISPPPMAAVCVCQSARQRLPIILEYKPTLGEGPAYRGCAFNLIVETGLEVAVASFDSPPYFQIAL